MNFLIPAGVRARLRKIGWVHEAVRARRAQKQEREYVELRDRYAQRCGPVFAAPGWKVRAREALATRWAGPERVRKRLSDVQAFVAVSDDIGGPRMLGAIARACDAEIFDIGLYRDCSSQLQAERSALTADQWRPRLQRDLLEAFRARHQREPFDVVFAYGNHLEFEPDTFRQIRASGVPVVDLCLDDKHIFMPKPLPWPNGQKPLIGSVDVHLTNSPDSMRWYFAEGAPAYFMPQGVDTEIFRRMDVEKTYDVVFIGQKYGARARLVEAIRAAGVKVECFGRGWGSEPVSDAKMIELYNRARINLGIGGTGVSERMTCIKGRDFEVPATGSLYLTSYNPELTSLFRVGEEIACYSNEIDCVELVRYYLERPEEAERVGRAGRERVLRDHTWEVRLRDLFQWMGILEPG
jgi:hypothetical protein